jgi:hypothetical protein
MGQREIENFNANARDFMSRFGKADGCACAQCTKVRREGYIAGKRDGVIEGLEKALDLCHYDPVTRIRAEIEKARSHGN